MRINKVLTAIRGRQRLSSHADCSLDRLAWLDVRLSCHQRLHELLVFEGIEWLGKRVKVLGATEQRARVVFGKSASAAAKTMCSFPTLYRDAKYFLGGWVLDLEFATKF